MTLGVGIIGSGFGGHVHLPAFSSVPGFRVRALCGRNAEKAMHALRNTPWVRLCAHWQEVVDDPQISVISCAVPAGLQSDIIKRAVQKKKHLFLEKPFTASWPAAVRAAALLKKSKRACLIDFEIPELDTWKKAAELLSSGTVGPVERVRVIWRRPSYLGPRRGRPWKYKVESGGGILNNFVSHCFHYLELYFGRIVYMKCDLQGGAFDHGAHLLMLTDKNTVIDLTMDGKSRDTLHQLTMDGPRGRLVLENSAMDHIKGFVLKRQTPGGRLKTIAVERKAKSYPDGRIFAVAQVLRKLASWIHTGRPQGPGVREALRVEELLNAARRSHAKNTWIKI